MLVAGQVMSRAVFSASRGNFAQNFATRAFSRSHRPSRAELGTPAGSRVDSGHNLLVLDRGHARNLFMWARGGLCFAFCMQTAHAPKSRNDRMSGPDEKEVRFYRFSW